MTRGYQFIEMENIFFPGGTKPENCPQPKSGEAISHEIIQLPYLIREIRKGMVSLCWENCNLPCEARDNLKRLIEKEEKLINAYSLSTLSRL